MSSVDECREVFAFIHSESLIALVSFWKENLGEHTKIKMYISFELAMTFLGIYTPKIFKHMPKDVSVGIFNNLDVKRKINKLMHTCVHPFRYYLYDYIYKCYIYIAVCMVLECFETFTSYF